MKKLLSIATLLFILIITPSMTFAQGMMGDGHTAREEAEGKEIWEKLQAKQVECKNLTNDNFESLGEYFMGQVLTPSGLVLSNVEGAEGAGSSHEVMNKMVVRMMGEEREKQMHMAMGKRNSGCGVGFMPMMWNLRQNPMGWFGFASWLVTLTWIVWLAVGVLVAIWLLILVKEKLGF